jgi:hypothetical protein
MSGDFISKLPVLTTGPPPAHQNHPTLTVPAIHLLTAASTDSLVFVFHNIGANDAREWHLAWIAFNDSVSIYPS